MVDHISKLVVRVSKLVDRVSKLVDSVSKYAIRSIIIIKCVFTVLETNGY